MTRRAFARSSGEGRELARLDFDGLYAANRRRLPHATVAKYADYCGEHLDTNATSDLPLAAFPFGNTNSTVDTSVLGLPTVAHFGPEGPAQTDKKVIHMAGLPGWTVCETDEEYYETAYKLIHDVSARKAALGNSTRESVFKRLFPDSPSDSTILRNILWLVYQNHEELIRSSKATYKIEELRQIDSAAQ